MVTGEKLRIFTFIFGTHHLESGFRITFTRALNYVLPIRSLGS